MRLPASWNVCLSLAVLGSALVLNGCSQPEASTPSTGKPSARAEQAGSDIVPGAEVANPPDAPQSGDAAIKPDADKPQE